MSKPWKPYVVQQGDHLRKIAYRCGADPDEIWNHKDNEKLRQTRDTGDLLHACDVIFLPQDPAPTLMLRAGTSNRYSADVPKIAIALRLESEAHAFADQPFEIEGAHAGETPLAGKAGPDGQVAFDVPVHVRHVAVHFTELGVRVPLRVGDLDPPEENAGVAQRLRTLGYLLPPGEVSAEDLAAALRAFQHDQGMPPTGRLDSKTRAALTAAHGH